MLFLTLPISPQTVPWEPKFNGSRLFISAQFQKHSMRACSKLGWMLAGGWTWSMYNCEINTSFLWPHRATPESLRFWLFWKSNIWVGDLQTWSLVHHACLNSFFIRFNIHSFLLLSIYSSILMEAMWLLKRVLT
jgi:hypothetical protein